jgi:hypothetical protein
MAMLMRRITPARAREMPAFAFFHPNGRWWRAAMAQPRLSMSAEKVLLISP